MGTLLCFLQIELSTANSNIMTMLHEILDALLERKQTWTTLYKSNVID